MIRNILAFVGLIALLGGLALVQFVWLSARIQDSHARVDVAKARMEVARLMQETRQEVVGLTGRAKELRLSARRLEIALERESESLEKIQLVISKLADAAKQAGLPKPSEAQGENLDKEIEFAGRTMSGAEVYRTLERWQTQRQLGNGREEKMQTMLERLHDAADQLESKQETLSAKAADATSGIEWQVLGPHALEQLETGLEQLDAVVREADSSDLDQALGTIQVEIDESLTAIETYRGDPADSDLLTPEQALAGMEPDDTIKQELDKLWEQEGRAP